MAGLPASIQLLPLLMFERFGQFLPGKFACKRKAFAMPSEVHSSSTLAIRKS